MDDSPARDMRMERERRELEERVREREADGPRGDDAERARREAREEVRARDGDAEPMERERREAEERVREREASGPGGDDGERVRREAREEVRAREGDDEQVGRRGPENAPPGIQNNANERARENARAKRPWWKFWGDDE
jgi:hypothetical protein